MTAVLPPISPVGPDYRIVLVSPREPSGVSWIINSLLELGIRVDLQPTVDQIFGFGQQPASAMWLPEADGRWRLHPRASALRKWLPILSRAETFAFRPLAPILHVQRLPLRDDPPWQVILFVRDLRDALHSFYRRLRPHLSWQEFVDWPHPETLLDAIDHWRLFMECWLEQSQVLVGRFEDYKADAPALLSRIVQALPFESSTADITAAAERSSYAAAAAAEARYRQDHPDDEQVANRAGLVGEWQSLDELRPVIFEIERRAGRLLTRLGYQTTVATVDADPWDVLAIPRGLSSFPTLAIPDRITAAAAAKPDSAVIQRMKGFAQGLTEDRLSQAPLEADEVRTLLRHLAEFSHCHAPTLESSIQALMQSFADGSPFHLARIRALLRSRRRSSTT